MLHAVWSGAARGRVNPLVPLAVSLTGLSIWLSGRPSIGIGIAVGAILAWVNALLLSRRVDLAALSGDLARAMMVMQLSLLIALTVVGLATVVLIHFSLSMAIASAAGFSVCHLAILTAFFFAHGRSAAPLESNA